MFVYAEYEHSFDTAVVEHRRVRSSESASFEPSHVNDFDRTKTYYVRSCRRDSRNCTYEGAKIIHMTGTLEEMASFKAKRPKRPAGIRQKDQEQEAQNTQPPVCKDREHIQEEERQQQIEDTLNSYKLEHCRPKGGVSTDLQQRLLAVEKELETLRQEGRRGSALAAVSAGHVVSKSAFINLKKKYERMQAQFQNLKNDHEQLAKSFQDRSQGGASKKEGSLNNDVASYGGASKKEGSLNNDVASYGGASKKEGSLNNDVASYVELESVDSDNDEKTNADSNSEDGTGDDDTTPKVGSVGENGKVYAGKGFWIDKEDWKYLFSSRTDSLFCRRASSLFWTVEELLIRSVTGLPSNRYSSGEYARLPMTPKKLAALRGLFRRYVGNGALARERVKAMRKHLSGRLGDLRPCTEHPGACLNVQGEGTLI
ncbi:hypothetical protein HPB50_018697 [Hyalomma asiaticum]|uniref:Uncharacterized protein n=1 Tax=Hyalomma asiaticum TaxID=266040 RepID=A0ACB7RZW5_HYAAI|nr:hypothetical protein HPB50_018697 [Hyalomma asiaticum]